MSILASVHKIASSLIPRQGIEWRKFDANATSAAGRIEASYGSWQSILAHVQPGIISSFGGKNISEKDYKDLGLDFSRVFYTIWTDDTRLTSVAHQGSSDQIKIAGKIFNVIQVENWDEFNGWKRCYCEEVIE